MAFYCDFLYLTSLIDLKFCEIHMKKNLGLREAGRNSLFTCMRVCLVYPDPM